MSLPELVQAFNALPRAVKTPSGLVDNHWHFAVRHVTLEPPGDILHIVNPGSRYSISSEGAAQILSCESVAERADIVLPILLKLFTSMKESARDDRFAPWSWGTDDVNFATALEDRLKLAAVRKELCHIRVGDEASSEIALDVWETVVKQLKKMTGPKCGKCENNPAENAKLLRCGGCENIEYCSKACQKADWKEHKIICRISAIDYWTIVAPKAPEAKELAVEIGLKLGSGGLGYPIRRLVVTGKDTPENFRKLLGWNDKDAIKSTHQSSRNEILLKPPHGSPNWAMAKSLKLDDNCPPWTPLPASMEEEKQVQDIRDMQELIRHQMGSRSMSTITSQDMQDVLVQNFASAWSAKLQTYQDAVNAMDQGVRI
ncbi:uncharacterized protein RSE6_10384 [Rhynchosporium secalis]|uniref:MYND-type domain-containing protein n=1 Tax=Rhynchosporium secalis TaxID=38038 RepID=A0A1E1MKA7_RHYSE|nr:uncharacterized protein RSE6_10384 [Rhynchosporium secalis]